MTVESMFKIQRTNEMFKHRHNIKEILASTNATPIRCQTGLAYLCCFCEEQYINPADLKKHTLESHAGLDETHFLKRLDIARYVVKIDITGLYCTLCYEHIESLENVMDHLRNVHKKTIYTDIGNQIVPFKFDTVNLRCCLCLTVFSKFKMLLEHMHMHYRNYICETCSVGYLNRRNLQLHSQTHQLGTFNCSFCSKVFTTLLNKNSHERSVHGHNLKKLLNKCPFCTERFNGGRKRDRHVAVVHGFRQQAIQCHACDKSFLTQDALTTHKKRDHLMQRMFKCSQCDKSFFSGNQLKNHMVKHTGAKEFVCEVCLKAYGRRKTLIEHLRIHADDRRFKCEHCGQAFVQKCSWRGHMRAKHGEVV